MGIIEEFVQTTSIKMNMQIELSQKAIRHWVGIQKCTLVQYVLSNICTFNLMQICGTISFGKHFNWFGFLNEKKIELKKSSATCCLDILNEIFIRFYGVLTLYLLFINECKLVTTLCWSWCATKLHCKCIEILRTVT